MEGILTSDVVSYCLQATCELCKLVEVSPISCDAKGHPNKVIHSFIHSRATPQNKQMSN